MCHYHAQDAYQRPYDPIRPVVYIDETNKQLVDEPPIPCGLGQFETVLVTDTLNAQPPALKVFPL